MRLVNNIRLLFLYGILFMFAFKGFSQERTEQYMSSFSIDEQLIIYADKGDTAAAIKLINQGASVNAVTYEGVTPLMFASQNGDIAMVSLLLQHGAKTGIKPGNGYTALISAIRSGYLETAEYLIRNGAEIDLADNKQVTPLMHAIAVDSFFLPDMMLYYGASVDLKDNQGLDALMMASQLNRYEIAIALLEAGCNIDAVDSRGNTALHHATIKGNTEIMDLLLLNGASLEIKNSLGYSPLSLATAMNNYDAVRLLIGYGADVNSRISSSLNPLTIAQSNMNDSLEAMLIKNGAVTLQNPHLNQFTFGTRFIFSKSDQQLGFSFGMNESKYHLMTNLTFGFRTKAVQVLEEVKANEFYQYWERRYFLGLSLEKSFLRHQFSPFFNTAAFAGVSEVLTFGGYKGSGNHPDVRLAFNPRIGFVSEIGFMRLKIGYEYMNLHSENIRDTWFHISIEFLFNRKKSGIGISTF